jgi:hypothetical protein
MGTEANVFGSGMNSPQAKKRFSELQNLAIYGVNKNKR